MCRTFTLAISFYNTVWRDIVTRPERFGEIIELRLFRLRFSTKFKVPYVLYYTLTSNKSFYSMTNTTYKMPFPLGQAYVLRGIDA